MLRLRSKLEFDILADLYEQMVRIRLFESVFARRCYAGLFGRWHRCDCGERGSASRYRARTQWGGTDAPLMRGSLARANERGTEVVVGGDRSSGVAFDRGSPPAQPARTRGSTSSPDRWAAGGTLPSRPPESAPSGIDLSSQTDPKRSKNTFVTNRGSWSSNGSTRAGSRFRRHKPPSSCSNPSWPVTPV